MFTIKEKKKWTLFRHHSMLFLLFTAWLMPMHITTVSGADHPELKAFPTAKEGMQRFIIVLPHKERGAEDTFKVEIIPGKTMLTDGVNLMRLGTTIEPRTLKGWGYTYYETAGQDIAMSTMMTPPDAEPQKKKFIQGTSLLIRYNSRLPIVVYAPQGYEIRYRIWETSKITKNAEQG